MIVSGKNSKSLIYVVGMKEIVNSFWQHCMEFLKTLQVTATQIIIIIPSVLF